MVSSLSRSEKGNLVLVFGSQALDFNETSASQLRSVLLGTPSLQWILHTIEELPQFWNMVSDNVPELEVSSGVEPLASLMFWLQSGSFPKGSFPLPNTILTPLVVISHLTQFLRFVELCQPDLARQDSFQESLKYKTETLGLCTGLLSSAAVSCSANQAQLQRYGAVAIRLAMVIGAMVDARDGDGETGGKWKSYSVGWNSAEVEVEAIKLLKNYPEAYVSVVSGDKRITISTPKDCASQLQKQLQAAGFSVTELGLRGSFHSERNRTEVKCLNRLCDVYPELQFLDNSELVFRMRSNTGGDYISSGMLHHSVVESILAKQSNWQQAFASLQASTLTAGSLVVTFGKERCIPNDLSRKLGPRLIQVADLDPASTCLSASVWPPEKTASQNGNTPMDDAIAVVGMSCQLPGGADLEGFWDALCQGKSQHKEAPTDRFDFSTAWRDNDPKKRWYGNFLEDYDTFDHKFFKKSPREMASTDPQHRLMLQIAYQAVEQSGYFNSPSPDPRIGCYIGVGLVDYENNIACYPATAYTATGNLKAFAAGKISHYFGWTGPGLTIDTACSSSAVAVHQACKSILTGECSAALAGGVNVMTSPEWFHNLAGASFLSPTGQCKPFDTKADGYCRAEGVGAVFLKKLSTAIADGDQVLGIIASSAVYQNENCTPITVPNASSLSDLFRHVIRDARLEPEQISVVEAHGTGTPVGDPAEYESVRRVIGGSHRSNTLSIGSVKGLLGHTESASGIVALIKTLLLIIKGFIPPQVSDISEEYSTIRLVHESRHSSRKEI